MENTFRIRSGDIVRHFKREMLTDEELAKCPNACMYKVHDLVRHTETGETMVMYEALYDGTVIGKDFHAGDKFVRPLDMFMGEVDHEKYPEIKQKYRMEIVKPAMLRNLLFFACDVYAPVIYDMFENPAITDIKMLCTDNENVEIAAKHSDGTLERKTLSGVDFSIFTESLAKNYGFNLKEPVFSRILPYTKGRNVKLVHDSIADLEMIHIRKLWRE